MFFLVKNKCTHSALTRRHPDIIHAAVLRRYYYILKSCSFLMKEMKIVIKIKASLKFAFKRGLISCLHEAANQCQVTDALLLSLSRHRNDKCRAVTP